MFPTRSFFLYLNIDFFPAAWSAYRGDVSPENDGRL